MMTSPPTVKAEASMIGGAAQRSRQDARRSREILAERAEWALAQMPKPLGEEIRAAISGGTKKKGLMSPRYHDEDTQEMDALALLDAFRAMDDYGVIATAVDQMVTADALDLIARRVEDVIWEEANLCRIFLVLRKFYRYIYLPEETPPALRHRISYYLGAARRDQSEYLRTPAEYIAGAVAVAGLADIMSAAGKQRPAFFLLRDACLMAVGAETNFRTQEYHHLDISSILWGHGALGEEASLFMGKEHSKNRKGRIGVVRDPDALVLLHRLIGSREDGALFCNEHGGRLGKQGIHFALQRTALLSLGVPVTSNLLRRAGVSDEESDDDMGRRIGDSSGGSRTSTAARFYGRSVASVGLD